MATKPGNLLYGLDDIPPGRLCIILAIQHILFLTGELIIASIALRQIGCPTATIQTVISMSMIAGGIATIRQGGASQRSRSRGRLAGYLVVRYANKVTTTQEGNRCLVALHCNH